MVIYLGIRNWSSETNKKNQGERLEPLVKYFAQQLYFPPTPAVRRKDRHAGYSPPNSCPTKTHAIYPSTTPPETNSLHLKMAVWNTRFLSGWLIFTGYVSFRECKWTKRDWVQQNRRVLTAPWQTLSNFGCWNSMTLKHLQVELKENISYCNAATWPLQMDFPGYTLLQLGWFVRFTWQGIYAHIYIYNSFLMSHLQLVLVKFDFKST